MAEVQVQWSNLLAFTERQNNHNYNYYLSHSSGREKKRKEAHLSPPNFKEYLVLDSSTFLALLWSVLPDYTPIFVAFDTAAPTVTRYSIHTMLKAEFDRLL